MTVRFILDTDHVSLLQRGDRNVIARMSLVSPAHRAVTVVTAAEQIQGRLAVIRRARSEIGAWHGLLRLKETIDFYQSVAVLPYDDGAVGHFERPRQQRIRIGTQDLRIAAIALSNNATLVTRNSRDFLLVPHLAIVDWSRYS